MAQELEGLIAKARRCKRPMEQIECAFGLADISTKPTMHEKLVRKGGVPSVLILLRDTQDDMCRRMACLALANIASHVFTRVDMVEQGVPALLVPFINDEDVDLIGRQYCAMCLGNLACDPDNHAGLMAAGVVGACMTLMRTEDMESGRYAAFCLGNLAANNLHRQTIVEAGAPEAFVALLCCESVPAQKQALVSLRSICLTRENRPLVVSFGILEALVAAARLDDKALLREVASAFNCLTSHEPNKQQVCDVAICTLVGLLLNGDPVIERHAACTCANLLEVLDHHDRFLRERGLPPLCALATSEDWTVKGEATRALANLASNAEIQGALLAEGVLLNLVATLRCHEENCQKFAALCLANLATTTALQTKVVQVGAVQPLCDCIGDGQAPMESRRYAALALANLSATVANHTVLLEDGCLQAVYSLANAKDAMSQYYVGCTLANLACNNANHALMVEEGGLQPIIQLAYSPDPDIHQQAAAALRGLCWSKSIGEKALQEGCLEPLTRLLASEDVLILREVSGALNNLAAGDESKFEIAKAGVIAPLIHHMRSHDTGVATQCAACLATLAEVTPNQAATITEGGLRPTIHCMRSRFVEVQRESGRLLANLCASDGSNSDSVIEGGGHTLLMSYLQSSDMAMQRVGAYGCLNICVQERHRSTMVKAGILLPLAQLALVEGLEHEIQRFAVLALCNLATSDETHEAFIDEGMLPKLVSLANSPSDEIRQYSAFALVKMSQNSNVRSTIVANGGLEPVLYLARTDSPDIQREVVPALCCLSFDRNSKIDITKFGGIPPVLNALSEANSQADSSYRKAKVKQQLALEAAEAKALEEGLSGVKDAIVKTKRPLDLDLSKLKASEDNDPNQPKAFMEPSNIANEPLSVALRQRLSCVTIANLSEEPENFHYLVDSGVIPELLSTLTTTHSTKRDTAMVRREACRALANLSASLHIGEMILAEGAQPPLMELLLGGQGEQCSRMAAMCLANLSSNHASHGRMLAEGMLEPVQALCLNSLDPKKNVDGETVRYALLVIANLASSHTNHPRLVTEKEITKDTKEAGPGSMLAGLALFSGHGDIKCRQNACLAIGNLCSNIDNLEAVLSTGCIKTLVTYAYPSADSAINVQFQAVAGIRGLAAHDTIRVRLMKEKVLEPLMMSATAQTSGAPAVEEDDAVGDAKSPKKIKDKKEAKKDTKKDAKKDATKKESPKKDAEATTSESSSSGDLAVSSQESGPAEVTVDNEVQREVAAALMNLAGAEENKVVMVRANVTPALVTLSRSADRVRQTYAISALANLCEMVEGSTQKIMIEQGLLKVLSEKAEIKDANLRREVSRCYALLATKGDSQGALIAAGALDILAKRLKDTDHAVCRYACFALGNLAIESSTHEQLFEAGVPSALMPLAYNQDVELRRSVAFAVNNLAQNPNNGPKCEHLGVLRPLVHLLRDEDQDVLQQSLAAIRMLCADAKCAMQFVDELQGLVPLLEVGQSVILELQRDVAATLRNLSLGPARNASAMVRAGVTDLLLTYSVSSDVETAHQSLGVLANIAETIENQAPIVATGALQRLKFVLMSKSVVCSREAVRTLANLSAEYALTAHLAEGGALLPLSLVLTSSDFMTQRYAALGIANLASNPANQSRVLAEGGLLPLVSLADGDNGDLESRRYALLALSSIASSRDTHPMLNEAGLAALFARNLRTPHPAADANPPSSSSSSMNVIPSDASSIVPSDAASGVVVASPPPHASSSPSSDHMPRSEPHPSLDREVRAACYLGLANLAANASNHRTLLQENCLEFLIAGAELEPDDEPLSSTPPTPLSPQSGGALAAAPTAIKTPSHVNDNSLDEMTLRCVSALRGLSCDADIRHLIVRRGGLRPLLAVVKRASDRDFKARHPPPPPQDGSNPEQQQVVKGNSKGKGGGHSGVKEHHWEVPLAVETIGALLNLSLSGCIGENPNRFLQACSANTLAEFLCSPDRIYRLFGATVLGNVAAAPRLQSKVIAAGALELLIEVANNSDLETQRCAAYALSNLATDYSRRAKIVVNGGLPSIVSLACSESASDAKAASATLRGLAASPLTRKPLVDAGVLDAFSQAAQVEDDIEVVREAAAGLAALSLDLSCKVPIAEHFVMTDLVNLAKSSDTLIVRYVCATIANLAEDKETHDEIVAPEGSDFLVALAEHEDVTIAREVARALCNLAGNYDTHGQLMGDDVPSALLTLMRRSDAITCRFAVLGASNLAVVPENHPAFFESSSSSAPPSAPGTEPSTAQVPELEQGGTSEAMRSGDSLTLANGVLEEGDSQHERTEDNSLDSGRSSNEVAVVASPTDELQAQPHVSSKKSTKIKASQLPGIALYEALIDIACGAPKVWIHVGTQENASAAMAEAESIANAALVAAETAAEESSIDDGSGEFDRANQLAAESAAAEAREEVKAVQRAKVAVKEAKQVKDTGHDHEAQRYACLCLGALASAPACHGTLMKAGLLQALLESLESTDAETRFAAAFCASKLSVSNEENQWILMGSAGLVEALVATVADIDYEEAAIMATAALRRLLASVPENRHFALAAGLLEPRVLPRALTSKNPEGKREAAGLMAHFTLSHVCRAPTVKSPCVLPLLELCSVEDPETARCACGAIANLGEDMEGTHRQLIFKASCLPPLIKLMRSKHMSVVREASRAVGNFLNSVNAHPIFLDHNGLQALFLLARSADNECQFNAALIYRKLAPNLGTHPAIVNYPDPRNMCKVGLHPLYGLAQLRDQRIQAMAAAALYYFASNHQFKVAFAESGGLRVMISLAREENREMRLIGCGALRHLSLATRLKKAIVDEGGLGPLFENALRHDDPPDGEVLAHCAATLANLAEDRRNQLQMPKDGAYQPLCRLAHVDLTRVDMNGDGDIDGYGDGGAMHSDVSRCLCSLSSRVENVGSCGGGTPFGPSELQALFHLAGNTCAPQNEHCRKDALVAVGNLAISAKSQQAIAKLGGVPCLAQGLASEYTSCRLYAARALYRVGVLPENQPLLVAAGAVPPLIQLSGDGRDVEVQRCAVMALCNATAHAPNALVVGAKLNAIPTLVRLLGYSGPPPPPQHLVLANTANSSRHQSRSTSKAGSRRSSKGQLTNNDNGKEVLGADGAPLSPRQAAAIELMSLGYADSTVTRFAAMALANLTAAHPSCQDLTVKCGGLAPLVALSSAHIQPPLVDPSVTSQTDKDGAYSGRSSRQLASTSSSSSSRGSSSSSPSSNALALPESEAPPPPPPRPTAEEESVRYAGLALCNLAAHKQHRVDIVRAGALRPLVLSLAPESQKRLESRRAAALALYNLSCTVSTHPILSGAQPASCLGPSRHLGVAPLSGLTTNEEQEGVPEALCSLAQSGELDTARFAMMAIANLTSGPAARAPSVAAGALPACVEAALHPDEPEIRRYGAVALMNLSAAGNAAGSVLVAHGGLSPLLQLCQSPHDIHASRAALKAILNLAANPFLVTALTLHGTVELLMRLTQSSDEETRELAVLCLCNLAGSAPSSSDLLRKLVKAGALAPMLALTTSNNEHARRIALVSLRKIALVPGHEQARDQINSGALDTWRASLHRAHEVAAADRIAHGSDIVRALPPSSTTNLTGRSLPPSSRSNAAGTSELAITEVAPAAAGQVPMHAAVGDELEVQQEVVTSVCFVSRDGKSRLSLARHPLIQDQVIRLAESGNVEVARHCVGCLANLLEDIQTHDLLVEPDDSALAAMSSAKAAAAAAKNNTGDENNGHEDGEEGKEGAGAKRKEGGEEKHKEDNDDDDDDEDAGAVAASVAVAAAEDDDDNTNMVQGNGDRGENVGKSCESTLLRLLEHSSVQVHREAARGISNLLTSVHYQHRTIKFGLSSLVRLSQSHDSETRYAAALCLRKLSPNLGSHLSLVKNGALHALMNLVNPKHRKPKNNPWFTPMAKAGYADPKKKKKIIMTNSSTDKKASLTAAAAMVAVQSPSKEETDRLINGNDSSEEESDEEEVLNGRSAITVRSHALAALRDLSDNPDLVKQFVEEGGIEAMVFVAQEMEIPSVPPSPTTSPVTSPRAAASSPSPSEAPAAAAKGVLALFGGGGAKKSPMSPFKTPTKSTNPLAASPFSMKGNKPLLLGASAAEAVPEAVPVESANHEAPRGTFLGANEKKAVGAKKGGGPSSELSSFSSSGDGGNQQQQQRRYNQRASSPVRPPEPGPDDDPTIPDGGRKMATVAIQALRNLSQLTAPRPLLLHQAVAAVIRCVSITSVAGEDLCCSAAALFANLCEVDEHRVPLVQELHVVPALVALAREKARDARFDAARALSHLACCEDNHVLLYDQGAFRTMLDLTMADRDVHDTRAVHFGDVAAASTFAVMGLKCLVVHPIVRRNAVKEGLVGNFLTMAEVGEGQLNSNLRRTAAVALASMSLDSASLPGLVEQGALPIWLHSALSQDPVVVAQAVASLSRVATEYVYQPTLVALGAVGVLCTAVARSRRWPPPHHLSAPVRADAAAAICALSEGNDLKEALVLRPWGASVHDELIPGDPLPGQPGGPEVGCYAPKPMGWGWKSSSSSSSSHLAGPANKGVILDMLLKDATDKPKVVRNDGVKNDKGAKTDEEESAVKASSKLGGSTKLNFKGKFGKRTSSKSPTPKSPTPKSPTTTAVTVHTDKPRIGKTGKAKGATTVLLECVYSFARANEVCQVVHAAVTLANICNPMIERREALKAAILKSGVVRPLLKLAMHPGGRIVHRPAAVAIAGLAIGDPDPCHMKQALVEMGCIPPLVEMIRFPRKGGEETVRVALLALNALTLGNAALPKVLAMHEGAMGPVLAIAEGHAVADLECVKQAVFMLGSLSEVDEVRVRLILSGAVPIVFSHLNGTFSSTIFNNQNGNAVRRNAEKREAVAKLERERIRSEKLILKRSAAYFLARLSQNVELHDAIVESGGLEACAKIAADSDLECQEYAVFSLAYLATNRELQRPLVELGVTKALVTLMGLQAEPRMYAGLALLKLADNSENHVAIARAGGLVALLQLGRGGVVDEEYKCAAVKTLGVISANVAAMMPPGQENGDRVSGDLSAVAEKQLENKTAVHMQKGRAKTLAYLKRAIKDAAESVQTPVHLSPLGASEIRPPRSV